MIRSLHNLSFVEDPCRAFRAVRFEQRFRFSIGKQTEAFIKNAVKKKLVDRLSGHRLLNELIPMLKEKKPLRCIRRMQDLGLLQFIHADLLQTMQGWKILRKVEEAVAGSKMVPLDSKPEAWFVYFLGLFYSLEDAGRAADRLQIPAKMRTRMDKDFEGCRNALKASVLWTVFSSFFFSHFLPRSLG